MLKISLYQRALEEVWKTAYAMDAGSYKQHGKNPWGIEGNDNGRFEEGSSMKSLWVVRELMDTDDEI